jgi:hypothetical protein
MAAVPSFEIDGLEAPVLVERRAPDARNGSVGHRQKQVARLLGELDGGASWTGFEQTKNKGAGCALVV